MTDRGACNTLFHCHRGTCNASSVVDPQFQSNPGQKLTEKTSNHPHWDGGCIDTMHSWLRCMHSYVLSDWMAAIKMARCMDGGIEACAAPCHNLDMTTYIVLASCCSALHASPLALCFNSARFCAGCSISYLIRTLTHSAGTHSKGNSWACAWMPCICMFMLFLGLSLKYGMNGRRSLSFGVTNSSAQRHVDRSALHTRIPVTAFVDLIARCSKPCAISYKS